MKNLAIFTILLSSATVVNAQLALTTETKKIDSIPTTEMFVFSIPMVGNVQLNIAQSDAFQQALMAFQVDSLVAKELPKETKGDTLKSAEKITTKTTIVANKTTCKGGINQ